MDICLLGASGSIGQQTLDVINKHPDDFKLVAFSVGYHTRCISTILKHHPSVRYVCIRAKDKYKYYMKKYPNVSFYTDNVGLIDLIKDSHPDMVVNALVGFVGLYPSLYTIENNIDLCLANKESLVVGGELINKALKKSTAKLYPIDSEHSALWKCLKVDNKNVQSLVLTASGGAFRNYKREQLKNVTTDDALNHPTWKMGKKITIDCATMVNKAFEVIEAYHLFHYDYSKINIILHDESHVHSYVKYDDYIRLDISKPDMRNPIEFALYKGKIPFTTYEAKSIDDLKNYHFHEFDIERYPMVKFAKMVIERKGGYGAVFNAANEVAVDEFLKGKISFLDIEKIITICMEEFKNTKKNLSYEEIAYIDFYTRLNAQYLARGGTINAKHI